MALETATYINTLVATNPTSGDPLSQGDDHLRLIKSVLQNTFPDLTGAVTATQTEINGVADGYATGTWSPEVSGSTSAGTTTYSSQTGRWQRVGNRVTFHAYVSWSAQTGTGNLLVTLPFASSATAGFQALSLAVSNIAYTAGSTPQAYINPGESTVLLRQVAPGAATVGIPVDPAGAIFLSGSYEV